MTFKQLTIRLNKQVGAVSPTEQFHFELLKDSWRNYLEVSDYLSKNGRLLGNRINPLVNEKNECWKQIVKLSTLFGLKPEARTKEAVKDPIELMMEQTEDDQG